MKKRKLLLVSANRFAFPYPVYPIGLSYIYSYIKKKLPELDIRILDLNLYTTSEFTAFLSSFQPDYTGISLRNVDDVDSYNKNWFIHGYKEIIDTVKTTVKTRIIIGGSATQSGSIFHIFLSSVDMVKRKRVSMKVLKTRKE